MTEAEVLERIKTATTDGERMTAWRDHNALPGHSLNCRYGRYQHAGARIGDPYIEPCPLAVAQVERGKFLDAAKAERIRQMSALDLLEYVVEGDGSEDLHYDHVPQSTAIIERFRTLKQERASAFERLSSTPRDPEES